MSNFVFYDFETSSSNKQWGQIIEVGAILTDDQLNELDRFAFCKLVRPSHEHHNLDRAFDEILK